MDIDAATLGTIIGAVVLALGGREGVAQLRKRKDGDSAGDSPSGQSVVTKAEAAAMVAEAERLARIEHNTTAILKAQEEHAHEDARRFDAVEKDLRDTRHDFRDRLAPLGVTVARVDRLEDDLRETRRQAGLDSQVVHVRPRRTR